MLIKQIYSIATKYNNSNQIAIGTQDNGSSFIENNLEDHIVGGDAFVVSPSKLFNRVYSNTSFQLLYIHETNPRKYVNFQNIGSGFRSMVITDSYTENGSDIDVILISQAKNIKRAYIDQNYTIEFKNLTNDEFDYYLIALTVSEADSNYLYALGRNNKLIKSSNLKVENPSFKDVSNNLPAITNDFSCVKMSNTNNKHLWMGINGYKTNEKVYYSANGGESWNNISTGLPNTPVNCLTIQTDDNKEVIYAGTDIGVYYYINGESQQWYPYHNNSLPSVIINSLDYNKQDKVLTAGTWGRGVWQISADGSTLSVDIDTQMPETIITAFPNPVSNKLYLDVNASIGSEAIISMYDITGKLVYSRKFKNYQINEAIAIDMNNFDKGMYILHFNDFQQKQTIKVLKQ